MNKLLLRALRKMGILNRISIYPKKKINNSKVTVPIVNGVGINNYLNLSEPWIQFVIGKLFNEDHTFMDVGVNIGQTLIKLKSVNKHAEYVGFEPNPLCVHYANELVKANKYENVTIYPVGISESSSVLKLNLFNDWEHDSAASIVEGFRDQNKVKKTLNVPVFNWSDLHLKTDKKIGIIKIDVEGAELEVLSGIKTILKEERPYVLIEILPAYSEENTFRVVRQQKIRSLLDDCDYKIYQVIKDEEQFDQIKAIDSIDVHSDLNLCEYILSPSEKANSLEQLLVSD